MTANHLSALSPMLRLDLRLVFRHGGFPGYAGKDRDVPKEIAIWRKTCHNSERRE
jgi:hypothetical protein